MKTLSELQSSSSNIVLAGGVFDIIHPGHINTLNDAKKLGDVAGRKLIWPGAGTRSEWDYDFVQAVYTSTIADYGKNWVNFWENSEDMPELQALQALGGSCANERTFGVIPVK